MTARARIAVYPGSFDPPTVGHVDIVTRATRLFDRVVIAVLTNPGKQPFFSPEDRVTMLREVFGAQPGVVVDRFHGLLVDYAASQQATAIVRGLRSVTDFDYERQMALMNMHLAPAIETVFLTPSAEVSHVSSTLVREIAGMGGPVRGLVPPVVERWINLRRDTAKTRDL